jgi:hypothetical protein
MANTTHRIYFDGDAVLELEHVDGVIRLYVEDYAGTVEIRIPRSRTASVEQAWKGCRAKQDSTHERRQTVAAEWLAGTQFNAERLMDAGLLDPDAVLAYRDRHHSAMARLRAGAPVEQDVGPICGDPDCDPDCHHAP